MAIKATFSMALTYQQGIDYTINLPINFIEISETT